MLSEQEYAELAVDERGDASVVTVEDQLRLSQLEARLAADKARREAARKLGVAEGMPPQCICWSCPVHGTAVG